MKPLHVTDWLHEPTASELKAENLDLRNSRLGWRVAAVMGWLFFAALLWLRAH